MRPCTWLMTYLLAVILLSDWMAAMATGEIVRGANTQMWARAKPKTARSIDYHTPYPFTANSLGSKGRRCDQWKSFPRYPSKNIVGFVELYLRRLTACDVDKFRGLYAENFRSYAADGDVLGIQRKVEGFRGFCKGFATARFQLKKITEVAPDVVYIIIRMKHEALEKGFLEYAQAITLVGTAREGKYKIISDVQSLGNDRIMASLKPIDSSGGAR